MRPRVTNWQSHSSKQRPEVRECYTSRVRVWDIVPARNASKGMPCLESGKRTFDCAAGWHDNVSSAPGRSLELFLKIREDGIE